MAELAAVTGDTASIAPIMQKIAASTPPKQAAVYESVIAIDLLNGNQGSKTAYAADAQKYADQATKTDPTNGQGWYALGVAQAQLHNKDQANIALKKAYDIFKAQNNPDMVKTIGDTFKQINGSDISGYTGSNEKPNQ